MQLAVRAGDAQGGPVGRGQATWHAAGELYEDGEDVVVHPFAHRDDEGVHLARLDVATARVVQLAVGYVRVEYAGVARGRAAVRPFGQGGQGDGVALPGGDGAADALLARPFRLGDGDVKRRLPVVPPPVGVQQGDGDVVRPGIRGQAVGGWRGHVRAVGIDGVEAVREARQREVRPWLYRGLVIHRASGRDGRGDARRGRVPLIHGMGGSPPGSPPRHRPPGC